MKWGPGGSGVRPEAHPTADLVYRLRGLRMAGAVLHLGAHPDDEDGGMLAYFSRHHGVRTVYWSATRGEGGQNRRGPETGEALGILRTWETLAAREIDGAEALYGPFYDFGFSKRGSDTLSRWGKETLVREIVRAIRAIQPLIVICRWRGESSDGHGHHQALGMVAEEAFWAAAEAARFPELDPTGLPPWQPRKLYRSLGPDWTPGEGVTVGAPIEEFERDALRLDAGEIDPIAGLTYQEQADLARNRHQSQGMGVVPTPQPFLYYYRLDISRTAAGRRDLGFFDGLDPTLTGLAAQCGAPGAASARLAEARRHVDDAISAFRPGATEAAGHAVVAGLGSLRELSADLDAERLEPPARAAIDRSLAAKAREFESVAAACLGLRLESRLDRAHVSPRGGFRLTARAWKTGGRSTQRVDFRLELPDSWRARNLQQAGTPDPSPGATETTYEISVPESAAFSSPYWLRRPRGSFFYTWPATGPLMLPFDDPLISVTAQARVDGEDLSLRASAVHESPFVGGFRALPLSVLPPLALSPQSPRELVPARGGPSALKLAVTVRCLEGPLEGRLVLLAPPGWTVTPTATEMRFERSGESSTVRFEVALPDPRPAGAYDLQYRFEAAGHVHEVDVEAIRIGGPGTPAPADEANCVAETFVVRPSTARIHVIAADFVRTLRYAYIPGAQDEVVQSLARFELDLRPLPADDLAYAELGSFHAIVVGPNVYLSEAGIRRQAQRLLDYVAAGGTLIVQYQGYGYEDEGLAPYRFRYRRPHDRVTSFDAPVEPLVPDHPVLSLPNEIEPADWDEWDRDRGLYFWSEWDRRYTPILSSHDPGEHPQAGGLLVANYGRGTYAYVGYSLFRQIPAGVPGGIRLFANLLGMAEARVRGRMERLRAIELFAGMGDDELYESAAIMSERWYEDGSHLCREGERGSELFLITDGTVETIKSEQVVGLAGPGDAIGELAILADIPRSATLRARGDVTALVMPGTDFRDRLRRHPHLSEGVIEHLAHKLATRG